MPTHRIFGTAFSSVYPMYVQKAERKSRTKEEADQIICWLTGYNPAGLQQQLEQDNDFETFSAQAPAFHPNSSLIKGVVILGLWLEEKALGADEAFARFTTCLGTRALDVARRLAQ